MIFERLPVGPLQVNSYILGMEPDVVIVDPGAESDRIAGLIVERGWNPRAILLTHGHIDHIAHVKPLVERFHVGLQVHEGERALLASSQLRELALLLEASPCPEPERWLKDGDSVDVAGLVLEVVHTPGHSPGGVCYLDRQGSAALVGDTLFHRGIGRTDLPGGSFKTLEASVRGRLFTLPDDTVLWPGHGPETTVGDEKKQNPFFGGEGRGQWF